MSGFVSQQEQNLAAWILATPGLGGLPASWHGVIKGQGRAAVTFHSCHLCKGSSAPVSGDKRCEESQVTLPVPCWDPSLDKQQDTVVGRAAGALTTEPSLGPDLEIEVSGFLFPVSGEKFSKMCCKAEIPRHGRGIQESTDG